MLSTTRSGVGRRLRGGANWEPGGKYRTRRLGEGTGDCVSCIRFHTSGFVSTGETDSSSSGQKHENFAGQAKPRSGRRAAYRSSITTCAVLTTPNRRVIKVSHAHAACESCRTEGTGHHSDAQRIREARAGYYLGGARSKAQRP